MGHDNKGLPGNVDLQCVGRGSIVFRKSLNKNKLKTLAAGLFPVSFS